MNETYRKQGHTTRLEQRGPSEAIIHTAEHGEASIADGVFRARTLSSSREPSVRDSTPVEACLRAVEQMIAPPLVLERSTVLEGIADHWWTDGEAEREWQERNARAHVTVLHPERRVRLATSLGGAQLDQIDMRPLERAIAALAGLDREAPPPGQLNLALEPIIAAELWPVILETSERNSAFRLSEAGSVHIRQGSHPHLSRDGTGEEIHRVTLLNSKGAAAFPNVFRPSYRIRPVRAPFHLEAAGIPTARAAPECIGVAALTPVSPDGGFLSVTLLCNSASGTFTGRISMPLEEWLQRLTAADSEPVWFPVGAGSYGQRILIEGVQIQGVSW
ncbi:MAG TPA: hypothetical protein VMS12_01990 [Thermoanaerobaculia bacterium]|nr:hypothetical protein [Thermoanaerobaculia bacterium]